jgi:hypothetical protein
MYITKIASRVAVLMIFAVGVLVSKAQDLPEWTFLFYANADNNLEFPIMGDLAQMAEVGSTDEINIIAQVDRWNVEDLGDDVYGAWTDTRRFRVEKGMTFDSEPLQNLGETNMGDPVVFEAFLRWGISNFPAKKYALVFSNHGGAWTGLGPDESNTPGTISLVELQNSIPKILREFGIPQFELIGFDACLMSSLDVLMSVQPNTKYVIAAEELVPGDGFDYTQSFSALIDKPTMDGAELGTIIVDTFMDGYITELGMEDSFDLHTIETAKLPAVVDALQAFVEAVQADPRTTFETLLQARISVQLFAVSTGNADAFSSADLYDLMSLVVAFAPDTDLATAAQAVMEAVDASIVYGRTSDGIPNANGISIYYPITEELYEVYGGSDEYPIQAPPAMDSWTNYLAGFYGTAGVVVDSDRLRVEVLGSYPTDETYVANAWAPPIMVFEEIGAGVVDLNFTAYRVEGDNFEVVATYPISVFVDTTDGRSVPNYAETPDISSYFVWDTLRPIIYDEFENQTAAIIYQPNINSSDYVIYGVYRVYDGDEIVDEFQASMRLDYDGISYNYKGMTGTVEGEYGFSSFNFDPYAGDYFFPYMDAFDNAQAEYYTTVSDKSIQFGENPDTIVVYYDPVPTGTYYIEFSIRDVNNARSENGSYIDINNDDLGAFYIGYTDPFNGLSFPYPYYFGSMNGMTEDDGDYYNGAFDDEGGVSSFAYIELESLDEMQSLVSDYLESYNIAVPEATEVDWNGTKALEYLYEYTVDDVAYQGAVYAFFSAERKEGYFVDLYVYGDNEDFGFIREVFLNNFVLWTPEDVTTRKVE